MFGFVSLDVLISHLNFTFLFYVFSDFVWSAGDHLIGLQQRQQIEKEGETVEKISWSSGINQLTLHNHPTNKKKSTNNWRNQEKQEQEYTRCGNIQQFLFYV